MDNREPENEKTPEFIEKTRALAFSKKTNGAGLISLSRTGSVMGIETGITGLVIWSRGQRCSLKKISKLYTERVPFLRLWQSHFDQKYEREPRTDTKTETEAFSDLARYDDHIAEILRQGGLPEVE